MQLAKLFKYVRYSRCAQIAFGVFAFLFFVTRLIIYPFFLLWSVLFEYPVVISHSPAWWIMVILLFILQVWQLAIQHAYSAATTIRETSVSSAKLITKKHGVYYTDNAYLLVQFDLSNDEDAVDRQFAGR